MSHEPPDIQNYPPSDFYLGSMRRAPSILFRVHVAVRRWTLYASQPTTKVNFKSQRPFKKESPRKHLHLIADQNIRVPFADNEKQSREKVFFFSNVLHLIICDTWSRYKCSRVKRAGVLRRSWHRCVTGGCRSNCIFEGRVFGGVLCVVKTFFFGVWKEKLTFNSEIKLKQKNLAWNFIKNVERKKNRF